MKLLTDRPLGGMSAAFVRYGLGIWGGCCHDPFLHEQSLHPLDAHTTAG